jgi:2,4-dienoyl-CoA reductase-like NADH-dependent reductase (Old Yellow Enzyme family)
MLDCCKELKTFIYISNNIVMDIQSLFTPFSYKSLNLKNRIVMPPMTRRYSPDGIPNETVAAYYARRAEGTGLILSEGTVIDRPASKHSKDIPDFFGPALDGWKNVVSAVHQNQGKIGPQLWHVGLAKPDASGWLPKAPFEGPNTMSLEDIQDTITAYANAALRAKNLGFDCVELHGAHGYLIDQFFWERTNQRCDEYGGRTLKDRTRFAVDVIKAVREAVGQDFVIIIRLSQWKLQEYTAKLVVTSNEMESWLQPMAEAGIDIFDCSTRRYWEPEFDGSDLNFAGWAKKLTGKPSITVGSVGLSGEFLQALFHGEGSQKTDFYELIRRFDRGDFDLVAVGRAQLQDPDWASKVKDGRIDELQGFGKESLDVSF